MLIRTRQPMGRIAGATARESARAAAGRGCGRWSNSWASFHGRRSVCRASDRGASWARPGSYVDVSRRVLSPAGVLSSMHATHLRVACSSQKKIVHRHARVFFARCCIDMYVPHAALPMSHSRRVLRPLIPPTCSGLRKHSPPLPSSSRRPHARAAPPPSVAVRRIPVYDGVQSSVKAANQSPGARLARRRPGRLQYHARSSMGHSPVTRYSSS